MIISALAFYLFATLIVASGVMVIVSRNPVHSVLFLILAFFNGAGLFILLGAEFLAMILVVVYVGAVAVLFLFVVMMLDINFVKLREGFLNYLPVGGLIGLILLIELLMVAGGWAFSAQAVPGPGAPLSALAPDPGVSNTLAIGKLIYTHYFYLFQAAGLVLLVAMIGAITLTLRTRKGVRKQNIAHQVSVNAKDRIELKKVKIRGGV
ncbi:MAG: NADH-quinone oxidoreductase subunit J [Rhodospirillaceae bacterium]|nr:NADH-quinone oxidoreductase subunit J [Rhodospirillaceae bacterium]MBT5374221.1 NADH-quinone oxidoreductase subunit J [Rhodospirillaceae bacterium]MBT5658919.1 NADH-quinone oxidoreductase subunit J [Rhodospirillaceae bacterium]MBT5751308.1 NADH-quinone oxidoreductase subunit J [Rhodospirillaceae bacterium]